MSATPQKKSTIATMGKHAKEAVTQVVGFVKGLVEKKKETPTTPPYLRERPSQQVVTPRRLGPIGPPPPRSQQVVTQRLPMGPPSHARGEPPVGGRRTRKRKRVKRRHKRTKHRRTKHRRKRTKRRHRRTKRRHRRR